MNLVATTAKGKPTLGGKFEPTGAALYYTYYAEAGISEVESNSTTTGNSSGRKGSSKAAAANANSKTETNIKERELKKLHEFFAPFEIPSKKSAKEVTPLQNFDL